MAKHYLTEQTDSDSAAKNYTTAQLNDRKITSGMLKSNEIYHADEDDTPALERRFKASESGAIAHDSTQLQLKTDSKLEEQVAAERLANAKKAAANEAATKLQNEANLKLELENSPVKQDNLTDMEKLYPTPKPAIAPAEEAYWRKQFTKANPLPKMTKITEVIDIKLEQTIKQVLILQITCLAIIGIAIILETLPLPKIIPFLANCAAFLGVAYSAIMLRDNIIKRHVNVAQYDLRDKLYIATIAPYITARYVAAYIASSITNGIFLILLLLAISTVIASAYYRIINKYCRINYSIKIVVYTTIFLLTIITIPVIGNFLIGVAIGQSPILAIFYFLLITGIPDHIAGSLTPQNL